MYICNWHVMVIVHNLTHKILYECIIYNLFNLFQYRHDQHFVYIHDLYSIYKTLII